MQHTLFDGALPSPDTVLVHQFQKSSPLINEPGFTLERFECALKFYLELGYTLRFFHMPNDATAVRLGIVWRQRDNVVVGLHTLADIRCPDTLEALEQLVKQYGFATEVDVLLLSPLDPTLPSFVLGLFPQQHLVKAQVHLRRWAVAEELLERFGMFVVMHGADGAAPHLLAQKTRQPNACREQPHDPPLDCHHSVPRDHLLWFDAPSLRGGAPERVSTPARLVSSQLPSHTTTTRFMLGDFHSQDHCHLGAKLRVRECGRDGHGVTLGNGRAVISLLSEDVNSSLWKQMMIDIRPSDFDPRRDPMNLPAFFRLTSPDVLAFLHIRAEDSPPPPPPPPSPPPPAGQAPTSIPPTPEDVKRAIIAGKLKVPQLK